MLSPVSTWMGDRRGTLGAVDKIRPSKMTEVKQHQAPYSTQCSLTVSHPSTDSARYGLTSVRVSHYITKLPIEDLSIKICLCSSVVSGFKVVGSIPGWGITYFFFSSACTINYYTKITPKVLSRVINVWTNTKQCLNRVSTNTEFFSKLCLYLHRWLAPKCVNMKR